MMIWLFAGCQADAPAVAPTPDVAALTAQAVINNVLGPSAEDLTATAIAEDDRIATAIAATLTAAAKATPASALTATAAADETRMAAIVQTALTAAALTAAAQTPQPPTPDAPTSSSTPTATGTPTPRVTPTPSNTPTPSATPTPTIDQQAMETAVAATLTALAPTHTSTPSVTPTPSLTPTPDALRCTVLAASLNLRYGPGAVYDPPIAVLAQNMELQPLARSENGWLEVRIAASGQTGWVSGDSQLVQCSAGIASLPLGVIPPTPTFIPSPTFTPTPVPPPVAPLQVQAYASSGAPYVVAAGGGVGRPVYSDRNYVYSEAPAFLDGAHYILTANADRERREGEMTLTLTANRPVQVYVAHSDAFAQRPGWLAAFADTGLDVRFIDALGRTTTLSLYTAAFPAGNITLGANAPTSGESHTMYTVIVAEAGP
jgi:hypothetical protein